jgi:hypothetical protein
MRVSSFFSFSWGAQLDEWEARTSRADNVHPQAEERAQELLRSWLSPYQLKQYDVRGHFEVVGCDSGKRYRIRKGAFSTSRSLMPLG